MIKWILIALFSFGVAVGAGLYFFKGQGGGVAVELDWRALGELDYLTHVALYGSVGRQSAACD